VLDLRLSQEQSLFILTPLGEVEVCATEVKPEAEEATIEVTLPEELESHTTSGTYKLLDELTIEAAGETIRLKVLRFRPGKYGGSGSVALGIDAPRDWPVMR
jgi:hypothetical protein